MAYIDSIAASSRDAVLHLRAYTAPHWPLHAHDEDIAKYKGRFDKGWDSLRKERLGKLVDGHPQEPGSSPTAIDQPEWTDAEHKAWLLRCMEVYAAQTTAGQGIGRIIAALEKNGQLATRC